MTKNNSDQFAKQVLEEVLSPFGTVETSYEVSGEPQWVDVFFVPTSESEIQELGLLGRMAQNTCLIEPYRNSPTPDEVRSCLLKLFQVQGEVRRQARRGDASTSKNELPFLWILASSASEPLLQEFGAVAGSGWPSGVYFCSAGFKTAIVSINKLPQTDETLWLRLLGKGRTQQRAIFEVLSFAPADPRRSAILRLLVSWKISLEVTQQMESEEEEIRMALSQAYLEWEKTTEQRGELRGERRGRQAGALGEAQALILRQLAHCVGTLTPMMQEQVQALSLVQLEELGEALLDFSQLSELEEWFDHRCLG